MGTQFKDGQKPKNRVTISKGGDVAPHKIDPDTGKVDRSFAQPNPGAKNPNITPKAHASAADEVEALTKNSTKDREYKQDEDEGSDTE